MTAADEVYYRDIPIADLTPSERAAILNSMVLAKAALEHPRMHVCSGCTAEYTSPLAASYCEDEHERP